MSWTAIDENIKPLIDALNSIPGVKTRWSCGGHAEIEYINQVKEGNWYIVFSEHQGVAQILDQLKEKFRGKVTHTTRDQAEVVFTFLGWNTPGVAGAGAFSMPHINIVDSLVVFGSINPNEYLAALCESIAEAGIETHPPKYEITLNEDVDAPFIYRLDVVVPKITNSSSPFRERPPSGIGLAGARGEKIERVDTIDT